MSTKALREILERVKENPNGVGDAALHLHADATAELEAIEKAASIIMSVGPDLGEKLEAYKALKSVWQSVRYVIDAKESP